MAYGDPDYSWSYSYPAVAPQGWVCPKCQTVYAPWVMKCTSSHTNTTTTTTLFNPQHYPAPYGGTSPAPKSPNVS
jgi:hypothetical protein